MILEECTYTFYESVLESKKLNIFNSALYNEFHAKNCDSIIYFLFKKNDRYKMGIIFGVKNNKLITPFSAPYGGFSYFTTDISEKDISDAIELIDEYAKIHGLVDVNFTLPPLFYDKGNIIKTVNALHCKDYTVLQTDLNHAIRLSTKADYLDLIKSKVKNKLKLSINNGLQFNKCSTLEDKKKAYEIIKINRHEKGYPLKLSCDHILKLSEYISIDFFMVNHSEEDIAAAIIYHVNPDVIQIVYWGDRPDYSYLKPMNYLAYNLYETYRFTKKYLDIGPSTENSIPNYGLCEFKEGIGCGVDLKFSFGKTIQE